MINEDLLADLKQSIAVGVRQVDEDAAGLNRRVVRLERLATR